MPRQKLKKRPDGRYVCKYHGKCFYGKTQGEAFAARDAYKRTESAPRPPEEVTLQDYFPRYLMAYKANCTSRVVQEYTRHLQRVADKLGSKPMCDVTQTEMQEIYNELLVGVTTWTTAKFHGIVKACFQAAADDGLLDRNPCAHVRQPKATPGGTHRALERWEIDLIQQTAKEHMMGPAAVVMLFAGLRRGEMLALDVDRDVDFDAGTITVRGSLRFNVGGMGPEFTTTKTAAGLRTIPLFPPARAVLEGKHGMLMPLYKGKNREQATDGVLTYWWRNYMKFLSSVHGSPVAIRMHDLRHTFATMLYSYDVDIKTAVKWMGHSDSNMILKVYAHLTEEKEKAAALRVEEGLKNLMK